jgi:hypothetical protein
MKSSPSIVLMRARPSWNLKCIRRPGQAPQFRVSHFRENGFLDSWVFVCPVQALAFFAVASREWKSRPIISFKKSGGLFS